MVDILYIYRMKILSSDPKRIGDDRFLFVNEEITKEGNYERNFAEAFIANAKKFNVVVIRKQPTQGLAIKMKVRGYGMDLFNLNKHCNNIIK